MNSEMESDLFTTLDQAKAWLQVEAVDGAICPCCQRFDKVYRRKVCKSALSNLTQLYSLSVQRGFDFYHYTEFFAGKVFPGDMARLSFIGLVERADADDDNKKSSGMYKITPKGGSFVLGYSSIPELLIFYHNELIGVSPETKTIGQFWPDFNYSELIGLSSNTEYLMK